MGFTALVLFAHFLTLSNNLINLFESSQLILPHFKDFSLYGRVSKVKVKVLSLTILVNRVAPISVSLSFGPHSYTSTVSTTVGDWPSGSTVCFTPVLFPRVLNAKQGNSMNDFSSLWYDPNGYRTPTYRLQCEHSITGPLMQYARV